MGLGGNLPLRIAEEKDEKGCEYEEREGPPWPQPPPAGAGGDERAKNEGPACPIDHGALMIRQRAQLMGGSRLSAFGNVTVSVAKS